MGVVKNSILIVGGGIGGLAAALACTEKGAKPLLIERAAHFSEFGAGIQMGPNVTRTLFSWGLEKALQEVVFVPQSLQVKDCQSGHLLGTLGTSGTCPHILFGKCHTLFLPNNIHLITSRRFSWT